jgi:hypothetical protein
VILRVFSLLLFIGIENLRLHYSFNFIKKLILRLWLLVNGSLDYDLFAVTISDLRNTYLFLKVIEL